MNRIIAKRIPAAISRMPKSYLTLMNEFPPCLIQNSAEYDRAVQIVHRLALREGQLDTGEEAYLDVLELLVEQYDREHHAIDINNVGWSL